VDAAISSALGGQSTVSLSNALNGQNLVACVAMDYMVSANANGGEPFTRFLIFGPSGQLLPSVNLDGRGEKFVPGACLVCHGGDNYAGQYPEDGSGFANVGGHWLPYDAGNFAFSDNPGLTDPAQEFAIYQLNQNVLATAPTTAAQALIGVAGAQGWYHNGVPNAITGQPELDKSYVAPAWNELQNGTLSTGTPAVPVPANSNAVVTYTNVIARSCRTCHVALTNYDFDLNPTLVDISSEEVCGGGRTKTLNHAMPNSLVTFNRFWNSAGTSTNQPLLYTKFLGITSSCTATQGP